MTTDEPQLTPAHQHVIATAVAAALGAILRGDPLPRGSFVPATPATGPPGVAAVWATLPDASVISGIGRTKLYEVIASDVVPSVMVCGRRLVNVPALLTWIAQDAHRVPPGRTPGPSLPYAALNAGTAAAPVERGDTDAPAG